MCSSVYEYLMELTIEQALQQGVTAHKEGSAKPTVGEMVNT